MRASFIWDELHEVRDLRQVFGRGFFVGGALAGVNTVSKGRVSLGTLRPPSPTTRVPLLRPIGADPLPGDHHDGKLTFDRLSSVFAVGQQDA